LSKLKTLSLISITAKSGRRRRTTSRLLGKKRKDRISIPAFCRSLGDILLPLAIVKPQLSVRLVKNAERFIHSDLFMISPELKSASSWPLPELAKGGRSAEKLE
jgi:hypothetical protein